jgi:drug/metabolite transporter (DMT)-like permease
VTRPAAVAGVTALTLVTWASAFPAIRLAVREYTPGSLALLRFLVASATLGLYVLLGGRGRFRRAERRDIPFFLLLGLIGVSVYHFALNAGERTVTAGTASLLIGMTPLFTVLLALTFLRERLSLRRWAGIAVGFAGATIVSLDAGSGIRLEPGAALVLLAALASASWFVMQKSYLARYSALEVTSYSLWAGTIFLLLFAPSLGSEVARASAGATIAAVYLGVVPGALGYLTWTWVLAKMPASRAAGSLYAIPPLAYLFSWIFLGEKPGPLTILGAAVVLGGVALVNVGRARGNGAGAAAPRGQDEQPDPPPTP